ncbi:hypothetical protein P7H15_20500 [Paenibacillus larvae]|nr:hypothetical protein [Paenibacillus larvae]MDT2294710.1 hypothetical protein [Paenibacillus larvae]
MSSEKKKEIRKIPGHHAIHDADNIKFDFVNHRKIFFWISTIIIVIGVIVLFWKQMNFGVDFKAGTSMDINVGQSITQEQAKDVFAKSAVDPQPAAVSVGEKATSESLPVLIKICRTRILRRFRLRSKKPMETRYLRKLIQSPQRLPRKWGLKQLLPC